MAAKLKDGLFLGTWLPRATAARVASNGNGSGKLSKGAPRVATSTAARLNSRMLLSPIL
jgi:hypothetical protein